MKYEAKGNNVIVEPIVQTKIGILHLTEQGRGLPRAGKVISIGPDVKYIKTNMVIYFRPFELKKYDDIGIISEDHILGYKI